MAAGVKDNKGAALVVVPWVIQHATAETMMARNRFENTQNVADGKWPDGVNGVGWKCVLIISSCIMPHTIYDNCKDPKQIPKSKATCHRVGSTAVDAGFEGFCWIFPWDSARRPSCSSKSRLFSSISRLSSLIFTIVRPLPTTSIRCHEVCRVTELLKPDNDRRRCSMRTAVGVVCVLVLRLCAAAFWNDSSKACYRHSLLF